VASVYAEYTQERDRETDGRTDGWKCDLNSETFSIPT